MATQIQERPKYNIFQQALFCTLARNTNLELKVVPIADLIFSTKN